MPLTRREFEQLVTAIDSMGVVRHSDRLYVQRENVKVLLEQWLVEDDRPTFAEMLDDSEDE